MASGNGSGGSDSSVTAAGSSGNATRVVLWIVIAALVGVVLFLAFKPAGGGIRTVDAAGVQTAIGQGAQVLDVRTVGEFQMGHIPGAVNVPVDQLAEKLAGWNRDTTYVVYCATGVRSATAVETMRSMGFKNIAHFSAGIQAWSGTLEKGAGGGATSGKIPTAGKPLFIELYTDS